MLLSLNFLFSCAVKKGCNSADEMLHLWTQCLCWQRSPKARSNLGLCSQVHAQQWKSTCSHSRCALPCVEMVIILVKLSNRLRLKASHLHCKLFFQEPVIASVLLLWAVGHILRDTLWWSQEKPYGVSRMSCLGLNFLGCSRRDSSSVWKIHPA